MLTSYVTYITIYIILRKRIFMKVWLLLLMGIFIFSGCSTRTQNYKLRIKNAQQSAMIQKQQAELNTLRNKLKIRKTTKQKSIKPEQREKTWQNQQSTQTSNLKNKVNTQAPKKNIVLKKVEDSNYSSSYMYPKTRIKKITPSKVKVVKTVQPKKTSITTMTKAECIGIIGTDKFAKYTQMFGSESASLKRCKMLKAMKQ